MDLFAEGVDVGGGEEAGAEAHFGEDICDIVAGGAFAVCACDVDEFEGVLGVAECRAECSN